MENKHGNHGDEEQGGPKRPRIEHAAADNGSDEDDPDLFASDSEEEEESTSPQGETTTTRGQDTSETTGDETNDDDESMTLHALIIYSKNAKKVMQRVQQLQDSSDCSELLHETTVAFPYTPLQLVCQFIPEAECIQTILNAAPETILDKTPEEDMSVFHLILQQQPSLELVEYMVQVYAKAKGVDMASAWMDICKQRDDVDGCLPIHYAIQEHAPTNVILKLLEVYPNSSVATIDGKRTSISTIHMAAYHGCSFPVLEKLLEHGTGQICDNRGPRREGKETPLHVLFHIKNEEKEQWKRWICDGQSSRPSDIMSPYKMAWYMIQKHAFHFKKHLGSKDKQRRADPKVRARDLIWNLKGQGNYSVMERAKELEEYISMKSISRKDYAELTKMLNDFEDIKDFREFPDMDFTEN